MLLLREVRPQIARLQQEEQVRAYAQEQHPGLRRLALGGPRAGVGPSEVHGVDAVHCGESVSRLGPARVALAVPGRLQGQAEQGNDHRGLLLDI